MKSFILIFLFILIGAAISLLYFTKIANNKIYTSINTSLSPSIKPTSEFNIDKAPPFSLKGRVISLDGKVDWLSRSASASSNLIISQVLQQGESVFTGDNSEVTIQFDKVNIALNSNTQINIIQTLPVNILIEQVGGTADFSNYSSYPLTVRIKRFLIKMDEGKFISLVNEENNQIIVKPTEGLIQVAYVNINGITKTIKVSKGNLFQYNYVLKRGVLQSN
jgi:hypothetical protein